MIQGNQEEKEEILLSKQDASSQPKENQNNNADKEEEKQDDENAVQNKINDHVNQDSSQKNIMKILQEQLRNNDFKISCLENNDLYKQLNIKNRNELNKFCIFEPLFIKAEQFVKDNNLPFFADLKNFQQFKLLNQYRKFNKKVRNQTYFTKNKKNTTIYNSESQKEDLDSSFSNDGIKQVKHIIKANKKNELTFDEPMVQLKSNEIKVVELRNKEVQLMMWKETINKCKNLNYRERTLMLKDHYHYDHSSFIDQLVRCSYETPLQDFFSSLIMISKAIDSDDQYANLIIHACAFYSLEGLNQQEREVIFSKLHLIIQRLEKVENPMMVYGFMKLLYMNDISLSQEDSIILDSYLRIQQHTWEIFKEFLIGEPILIRKDILNFVPRTGFFFTGAFINSLKTNEGGLYSQLPIFMRQRIIEICVYISVKDPNTLFQFVNEMGKITLKHDTLLMKSDFQELLKLAVKSIQERSKIWINQLEKLQMKLIESIQSLVDRKIKNFMEIKEFLTGNDQALINSLQQAQILEEEDNDEKIRLLESLHLMNSSNTEIQEFQMIIQDRDFFSLIQKIENKMDRKFHYVQKMCLAFIVENYYKRFSFINFGIGSGKSLICAALAIILRELQSTQVVILNKSKYLAIRDFNKYKDLVKKFKITCVQNEFYQNSICYWDELQLISEMKKMNFKTKHQKTIFIIDEYDQFLFDGKTLQQNFKGVKILREMSKLVGLSGSTFTELENEILFSAFETKEAKFPSFRQSMISQVNQADDIVIDEMKEWKEKLVEIVKDKCKEVPCLIVLNEEDLKALRHWFKKNKFYDLDRYLQDKNYVELQHKIDYDFIEKYNDQCYGVYFMSESLGRGTDFPSNNQIEAKGGIFLLMSSIFDSTTTEQIKGRVGRLQNKGQVQYCVLKNTNNVLNNYVRNQITLIDTNNTQILEKLLVIITQQLMPLYLDEINNQQHSSFEKKSENQNEQAYEKNNELDQYLAQNLPQSQNFLKTSKEEQKDDFQFHSLNTANIKRSKAQIEDSQIQDQVIKPKRLIKKSNHSQNDLFDLQSPSSKNIIPNDSEGQGKDHPFLEQQTEDICEQVLGKQKLSQTSIQELEQLVQKDELKLDSNDKEESLLQI